MDDTESGSRPASSTTGSRRPARLSPHAVRQARRARRTWFAVVFFPVFAVYLVLDALRDARDLLERARSRELQARGPFTRPADMPAPEDRTVGDIVRTIEGYPLRSSAGSAQLSFFRDNGPDALSALLSANPQMSALPHAYPTSFRHRLFTGSNGAQIAGMQSMHAHAGPAVIICHGLLMNKHFDLIIQLARRAFETWGFHVVTLDLRGWGHTAWTHDGKSSAGFHEGRDIIEVARELHRDPRITSVAGVGYSLGGASMLNAAVGASAADDATLDGGVVCVSAPTDIEAALDHISTRPAWRDPLFGLWYLFRAVIKGNVRRLGLRRDLTTWRDLVKSVSAPAEGLSYEEFCTRASATTFAQDISVPLLALHAADDFVVPVRHAYRLRDAAAGNPWVHVLVRDTGSHCSFVAADASWFHSTLRRWLEYWATPGDGGVDEEGSGTTTSARHRSSTATQPLVRARSQPLRH